MVCNQGHRLRAVLFALMTPIGMMGIRFFSFRGYFPADAGKVKYAPLTREILLMHPFVWQCFDAGGKPPDGHMR
jgi:hypothetical protein